MDDIAQTIQGWLQTLWQLPWLELMLFGAPFLLLAWWKKIFPHMPLVILTLVPCVLTFGIVVWPDAVFAVVLADLTIIAICGIDLLMMPATNSFSAERQVGRIASLAGSQEVGLTINNNGKRSAFIWVRDDIPEEFEPSPAEFALRLAGRSRATLHYHFQPQRRGAFQLNHVHVRVRSRLGLWKRFVSFPVESTVHVYPDMKQLAEYSILARTNRLSLMGLRRTRRVGQDNEFERLRDYSPDDNYKHLDWRATARRNKLTVKDFQSNQSQRIIFLIDCGRMMTNTSAGLSLLDHSLNAMLMLSYVALRQGDQVGLICFSDEIHTFVPLRGGASQMNHLLHASFDRFPRLVESRYDEAFLYLASRCKKRSLVVLMSNVIDEVNSNQLEQYLTNLVGRHLPLGVLLRDHELFDAADRPNPQGDRLFQAAAAAEILTWRHQVLTDLQHRGVLALDVFPEDMTAPLVNQYLEIKARHLL